MGVDVAITCGVRSRQQILWVSLEIVTRTMKIINAGSKPVPNH
jgi:hypothetical protein